MNRGKLLAAVAVMAMVFAAVAVVSFDGSESDAAVNPTDAVKIDGTGYATLDDALKAASAGATIEALKDIQILSEQTIDKDVTLNLGNYRICIDSAGILEISADVTITNATTSKYGLIYYDMGAVVKVNDGDELVLTHTASGKSAMINEEGVPAISGKTDVKGPLEFQMTNATLTITGDVSSQAVYINATGSTINARSNSTYTFGGAYLDLTDSTVNAGKMFIYAADLKGTTKVNAGAVSVYEGATTPASVNSKYTQFTVNTIEMESGVEFNAESISPYSSGTAMINFSGAGALNTDLNLTSDANGYNFKGVVLNGDVINGKNTVAVSGITGDNNNGLTYVAGSVKVNGITKSPDGNGQIVVNGGDVVIDGTISEDVDVVIKNANSVDLSALDANNGSIQFEKAPTGNVTLPSDTSKNIGTIGFAPGVTVDTITNYPNVEVVSTGALGDSFGMSKDLESDYTVKSSAFLEKDLTVPEGITLTVQGNLDLNGKTLTVYGKLVVENKGQVQTIGDGKIVLGKTGEIVNNGIIGYNSVVSVSDEQSSASTVSMKNVVGANFTLTKEIVSGSAVYKLTVSGDISKKGTDYSFAISNAYIGNLNIKDLAKVGENTVVEIDGTIVKNGHLTIGSKTVVKDGADIGLRTGAVITIDGTMGTGKITLVNGTVANVNSSIEATITAETGEYDTYDTAGARNNAETELSTSSTITLDDLKGIVIEITSKTYTEKDASNEDVSKTEQMMNLYGAPSLVKDADDGTIDISGNVYVPADKEIVLGKNMSIDTDANPNATPTDTTSGVMIINGKITSLAEVVNYKGAAYSIKSTDDAGASVTTYYYTTFDNAFGVIADIDDKTVTLMGGYTFEKDYTVKAGETVDFADNAGYKISKDATITVNAEGTFGSSFVVAAASTPAGIAGTLIVMDGADCTPAADSYEVKTKDADDNMTYSGAGIAIETAGEGTTVYIVNNVTFEDRITVPAGVTVDVDAAAKIDAQKGLAVNGTIINKGTVEIGNEYDLDVAGKIQNEGTVTLGTDSEATITGVFEGSLSGTVNAAKYNDGEKDVYTTFAGAVEAVSKMDNVSTPITVNGEFSESSDVVLVESMRVTVVGKISISSVTIPANANLIVNGELSGDVKGIAGKGVTEANTTVSLVEASNVSFTGTFNEATSVSTFKMKANTTSNPITGTVEAAAGTVSIDGIMNFNGTTGALVIGDGATVAVGQGASITVTGDDKKVGMDVAGTLDIVKGAVTVYTDAVVNVSGTVKISETDSGLIVNGGTLNLTGTIDASTVEGKEGTVVLTTDGLYIGSAPETLGATGTVIGKVSLTTYMVVYAGSDLSKALINTSTDGKSNAVTTEYTVNGSAYATVYAKTTTSVTVAGAIAVTDVSIPGYDKPVVTEDKWVNSKDADATNAYVGTDDFKSVNLTLDVSEVEIKASVDTGMTLYVDNIKVVPVNGMITLSVGEHTVKAAINPGYTGTTSIFFNGAEITNGKIVVTADMVDGKVVLSGVGEISVDNGGSSSDNGMGITDYLLIILVVMVVILAIVVIMRMMRS